MLYCSVTLEHSFTILTIFLQSLTCIKQLLKIYKIDPAHFVARFKAQLLVKRPSHFGGMQSDVLDALIRQPCQHHLHDAASNATPAVMREGHQVHEITHLA